MTIFTFANNINTTLAGAVSPSATTITLASTANLPASIPAGEVLVITLNDVATRQNFEIVYATARTGATLTVLRAQEGTAALAWLTGDFAYSPPTAGQQASFGQFAEANTWTGANTFTSPVTVAPAVTSGEAVNLSQFISGANGNGAYYVFPGGMQLCRFSINSVPANSSATWTFPLSYISPPQIFPSVVTPPTSATLALWISAFSDTSATIFNPNATPINIDLLAVL